MSTEKEIVVCHILNSLLPSGAETMLVNSSKEWNNCKLHVLATLKDLGNYADAFEQAGYTIHHIYNENFIKQHLQVQKFLRDLKPDVVHIHRESQECYYALDARISGIKHVVRTVHNVFSFTGYTRIRRIITRAFSRVLGTKYVGISQSVYDNENNRFYNKPSALIDNWCDEQKYKYITYHEQLKAQNNLSIDKERMIIVSVGNCTKVKNHMMILKGLKFLISQGMTKFCYYHIGSGNDESLEKKYVSEHNLEEYVKFQGHTDPIKYLKAANLFIMPSTYEGVGISAMEAMFCGIPCLLTDVDGLRDFKELQCDEIYYCNLNEESFNSEIMYLYTKWIEQQLQHSEKLANITRKKYDMEKSVKEYLKIYKL